MNNKLQTTRWAFDLSTWSPTLNQLTQAVAAIQLEERRRLMKFHFMNDFLSSLVGRLLMRKYVSQCCDLSYEEVKFSRDDRGKPHWIRDEEDTPAIAFNVSHQGRYVILTGAVNNNAIPDFNDFGIGCDVMKLEYAGGKSLQDFFRLMNKKFAQLEWDYIKQPHYNMQQQLKAFMRHWCLKEAYVKEIGVGITVDLQKIAFSVDKSEELTENKILTGTTLTHNDLPLRQFNFEEHMLHPKYCAAVAFRNFKPEKVDKFAVLQITDLLKPSLLQDDEEVIEYCRIALKKSWK